MESKVIKYKKKPIPPVLKEEVWRKYFGNIIDGICICGNKITFRIHETGHIISEKMGGETNINNLRPICISCNRSMGIQNMVEYTKKYFPNNIYLMKPIKYKKKFCCF